MINAAADDCCFCSLVLQLDAARCNEPPSLLQVAGFSIFLVTITVLMIAVPKVDNSLFFSPTINHFIACIAWGIV